jgi:hypothetical protein
MLNEYSIRIEKGDGSHGNREGHRYTVVSGGCIVVAGWTNGGKRDARQEAKRALTEMGIAKAAR